MPFGIVFHRYEVLVIFEDNDGINIIATSNNKNVAEKMFDRTVKEYTTSIITTHFRIVLLDIDRDAEIKSYDSRTDLC